MWKVSKSKFVRLMGLPDETEIRLDVSENLKLLYSSKANAYMVLSTKECDCPSNHLVKIVAHYHLLFIHKASPMCPMPRDCWYVSDKSQRTIFLEILQNIEEIEEIEGKL